MKNRLETDEITTEVLIVLDNLGINLLHQLAKYIYNRREISEQVLQFVFVMLVKKSTESMER